MPKFGNSYQNYFLIINSAVPYVAVIVFDEEPNNNKFRNIVYKVEMKKKLARNLYFLLRTEIKFRSELPLRRHGAWSCEALCTVESNHVPWKVISFTYQENSYPVQEQSLLDILLKGWFKVKSLHLQGAKQKI